MQSKRRPRILQVTFIFCFLLALVQCKREQDKATSSDSTVVDTTSSSSTSFHDEDYTAEPEEEVHDIIEYNGAADDQFKTALKTFAAFDAVSELARLSIQIKDSLESARNTEPLKDPKDSLVFRPAEIKAYRAIMDYKKLLESSARPKDDCPTLLDLTRRTASGDSTDAFLPAAGNSKLFANGNFFFLGGAPFITQLRQDDKVFTDPKGNPEAHYVVETENTQFLLTSISHLKNVRFDITFGPPIRSYDYGPQEVNGIGSIIHNFVQRIPVFFFTKAGLVPAELTNITLKIVPEGLGCVSDWPMPEFACSQNLSQSEILGIYIPYDATPITTCAVTQQGPVWTADLNGDGIADLAGVSSTSLAEASGGVLSEVLWFVNINGTWKIIDWNQDPDCT